MELSQERAVALKKFLSREEIGILNASAEALELFNRALTHGSTGEPSYERLEFLGDRVLNLLVAEYLFSRPGESTVGEMTKKMEVISNANLGAFVEVHHLFQEGDIQMGKDSPLTQNIRADILEAFVGAVYLGLGLPTARRFVRRVLDREIDSYPALNYIGQLQEHCQKNEFDMPLYTNPKKSGRDHEPTFTLQVKAAGVMATGTGKSIGAARQDAAMNALADLGILQKKK